MLRGLSIVTALAVTLALAPLSAQALIVTNAMPNGNVFTDFSVAGNLDLDTFFNTTDPLWLRVELETVDIGINPNQLAFSSRFDNVPGMPPWTDFHIELEADGAAAPFPTPTFDPNNINTLTPANGAGFNIQLGNTNVNNDTAWIFFNAPEPGGAILGSTNSTINPGVDWFIDLNGLQAGQSFLIHLAPSFANGIPEPVSATLGLMGIAALSAGLRRRRIA